MTREIRVAGYGWMPVDEAARLVAAHDAADARELRECEGHPAGPFEPMGETVYCDGSCR